MKAILETKRLLMREMTVDDFNALYDVLADSDIMQHYPYTFDEERVMRWITRNIERYRNDGFGLWAVILKETGEFIGDCGEFPCETLKSYAYDPEQGDNGKRIENCTAIKTALVAQARQGVDPVSVCGYNCDHCFMGQWCGGCRSSYNCCSFATLYDDGVCPNVACVSEKGLDGCYDCEELEDCTKGYYGQKNEYAAKATALFIREYGKEAYSKNLAKAISKGMKYAKSLDEAGSVQAAFSLMKGYYNEH